MTVRETVEQTPLVDNHAHAVERLDDETIETGFAGFFTEGDLRTRDARHTLNYRAALGVLADRFGVDPSEEAELLAERAAVDGAAYTRECIAETNTETILVDSGYPDRDVDAFRAETGATVHPMLRLEPVIEALIDEHNTFSVFEQAFEQRVRDALRGEYVALKSIAAYRRGLNIGPADRSDAQEAFDTLRPGWDGRVESPRLLDYCLHSALTIAGDLDAPVQFHTGFGDPDAHPRFVNPVHLVECIEAHPETEVVMLHGGYPYVGQAGYVTATYPNVHLDLSLAIPFAQHGARRVLSTAMEVAPATKLLYGSDAFSTPELFVLGARRFRDALATVLADLVSRDIVGETYAETTARNVLRENAVELYDL